MTESSITAVRGAQVGPMAICLYETEKSQHLGNGIQKTVKGTAEDTKKPPRIKMEIFQEGLNKKVI